MRRLSEPRAKSVRILAGAEASDALVSSDRPSGIGWPGIARLRWVTPQISQILFRPLIEKVLEPAIGVATEKFRHEMRVEAVPWARDGRRTDTESSLHHSGHRLPTTLNMVAGMKEWT